MCRPLCRQLWLCLPLITSCVNVVMKSYSKTWSALGVPALLQNRTAFYCSLEMLSVSSPDYWGKNVVMPLPYSGKKVPQRTRVRLPVVALSGNNLGQVVCTHVPLSLTKQYNLVKGRWCPAAGKVTDFCGLSRGDEQWVPHLHSSWCMAHFTLP